MKAFKFICILFALTVLFSCDNYPDMDIQHTPVFATSGDFRVRITDLSTNTLVTNTMYIISTYNTTDNKLDSMWIRTTSNMAGGLNTLRGKISCNVNDLTFKVENGKDISPTHLNPPQAARIFTISEGKITPNAITLPSGAVVDKISFKYQTDRVVGKTFLFEGYRRSLWPEDESFITF